MLLYLYNRPLIEKPMRFHRTIYLLAVLSITQTVIADPGIVEMQTNLGTVTLKLNPEKAPITVENFINYVDSNFYQKTLFHRVIKEFVIQGGGYDLDTGKLKATNSAIVNEANNGLSNIRGSISMARTSVPNSATSQFFINLKDNVVDLDINAQSAGYAVFGEVISGMDVVDSIGKLITYNDLPYTSDTKLVFIENVYLSDVLNPDISVNRMKVSGDGKVYSSPKGINCSKAGADCTSILKADPLKTITLTAKPSKGFLFVGWTGDCSGIKPSIKLPLTKNNNCTATFKSS